MNSTVNNADPHGQTGCHSFELKKNPKQALQALRLVIMVYSVIYVILSE